MADNIGASGKKHFKIGVQEGEIRKGYTAQGTGSMQQKFQRPVQTYIADGDMFEVDINKKRLYPDTGNGSIPRGLMAGTWQSRTEGYSQADVDRFLDPKSPTYNPANYERMMAQARCDAYAELQSGSHVWDTMTRDERNAMRISNPQRAQALEQNFFARLDEKYGPDAGEAMAMEYGYTEEDLYGEGVEEDWDSRTEDDFDRDPDWIGDDDMEGVPNRAFTPTDAMQELEESRSDVEANPYLDADAEKASLEALDQEELKTGVVRPQAMYAGNDGFAGERHDSSLRAGEVVSRYEEKGRPGSTGSFTSRAVMGDDGRLSAPSFQDRSMVEMEETMQQHFFQVADDYVEKADPIDPVLPEALDPAFQESHPVSTVPDAEMSSPAGVSRVEALREALAQSVDETSPESVAQAKLGDYFARTGYGPQDKAVYEADPEWQSLHRTAYPDFYADQEKAAQRFQPYQETVAASSISGVDTSDPNFWNHHGYDRENYMSLASHLPEVQERMRQGATYEELREDPVLGPTARAYYGPDDPITVEKQADGSLTFGSDGRHRIAAAQELGYDVDAKVMYDHGWKGPDQSTSETTVDTADASPRIDTQTDSGLSAGETVGLGAAIGAAATLAQNEAHSEGSSTPTASSASLGDRYQSSYADRIRQTPSLESNRWAGERGESVCAPQSDAARQIMEERGISGVQYQDGVPDFSPFSESTVKLGYMTDARHSQGLTAGRDGKDTIYAHFEDGETVSESHHADKSSMADLHMKYDKPGNFEQADALTAEQWTVDGRDGKEWTAEDVAQYRQDHGLTWHECNDMETMQMIPEAINADFGHLGGVGEVKETQRIVDEALRDYDEGQMVEAEDYDKMTPEELEAAAREHGHYTDDGVWVPDDRSVEPVEEKIDQGIPDEQAVEDSNPDSDEGYLKVEHGEETGTRIDDIATQTEGDDLPDNNTSLAEETSDDIKDAIPDASKETGVSGEQAVDQMETAASDENMEQAAQGLQENTSDTSVEDAISDTQPIDSIESAIPTEDVDQLEQAGKEPPEAIPDTSVEDAVPDEQTIDHIEDAVNPDNAEQATQDLQEATPDTSAEETVTDEQAVDQMESAIPSEEIDRPEQVTQEFQENIPEAFAEDAATDDQMEEATLADDIDQSSGQEVQDSIPDTSAENAVSDEQTAAQIDDAVLSDDVEQTEEVAQELRENAPDTSVGDTMADEQSVDQMEAAIPDDDVTRPELTAQELQDGTPDNSAEGPVSDDQAVDQMNGSVAEDDMDKVEETSQELQEDTPDSSIPDDGGDLLEQAAREQGAEEQAVQETVEQEAEEQAAQETVEQEAEEQAAQETAEQEAEEQAAQETAEQEAEEQAAQETAEQEAEEQAAQEAAEQEAEEQAAQEAAEQEADEQAAQEAAEQEAEEQTAQEAAEQEAQEAAEQEVEEQVAQEAADQEAQKQAAQEAAEQEAEEQAAQESVKQEAEEQAAQEAEEQAAQEAAEQETEEQATQEAAEQEAEEQAAQEAVEQEAEEQAAQETAEQEAEEQAAQEAAAQEAEEQAAQEAAEQEAEEQATQEAEEQAAQETAEQEAEEQAAQETAEQEAEEQAAQETAEQEAEEQAAQEAAEQEAEEQAAQEAAEQEAEEQAAQEATEQEAEEQAAQEAAEQEDEEQAAQEAAEQEAEEQAAQEATEQEAEEQAAQEAAEQEAEEQAAQEAAEQEAEEQAAQEAAEQEAYDEFADEQAEEDFTDAEEEDYSDLADEPVEESYDDTDYSDLADEAAEDYVDDSADYSDMADDIDSGSYDDSSFDSSDATFDSGDTGSFDGGGNSIE